MAYSLVTSVDHQSGFEIDMPALVINNSLLHVKYHTKSNLWRLIEYSNIIEKACSAFNARSVNMIRFLQIYKKNIAANRLLVSRR